jgi:hypothetical protein
MERFFASPQMRRNTLSLVLCLLAVLFALEAKTAWYGPAKGPGSDVQSEKARPADLPAAASERSVSALSWPLPLALIFSAALAAMAYVGAGFLSRAGCDPDSISVSASPYFFAGLFFRPPPAL